jgi:hypothetical protein
VILMLVRNENRIQRGGIFARISSRQESPASISTRVSALATTVEFPFEPEARTVMRIISTIRRSDVN